MKQIQARLLILTIFISISAAFLFPGVGVAQTVEEWIAKVVSVQGDVHARKSGETEWVSVKINDTYCFGDIIRTQERSRAAIVLRNDAILRLDQKTTIIFSGLEKEYTSLLDLITGAAHFFSRVPRGLKVVTPFVNAAVEGTETDWQAMVRMSIVFYWEGDLTRAFFSLKGAPENIRDPRFFTYRAGLMLTVGCLEEASIDIKRALDLDPGNSHAFALQSVVPTKQCGSIISTSYMSWL